MKRPITNIDKTIQELTNRLDVVHPYTSYSSINYQNSNDGINYWKGKKIISAKDWNDLYKKNLTYTDTYKITLTSRKPLQYFPDDYNGSITSFGTIKEELKGEAQKWNNEYYELLEFKNDPTLGRIKCTRCILSTHLDDPIFIGIGKVVARIVDNNCNNTTTNDLINYPCNIMNIFNAHLKIKQIIVILKIIKKKNQNIHTKEKIYFSYKE